LRILISDDASSDGTSDIVREVVSAYKGPHDVSLNVNQRNLGIGAHVNKVFSLTSADLLVVGAGDDVSHPTRVEKVVGHWAQRNCKPLALYSGAVKVDADGKAWGKVRTEIEDGRDDPRHLMLFKDRRRLLVLGATAAYDRRLMEKFGPLDADLPIEDIPLLIRARMSGEIAWIPEELVDYRTHVSVWRPIKRAGDDLQARRAQRLHYARARAVAARQVLKDAIATGEASFVDAAARGYLLHSAVRATCESRKVEWRWLLANALGTGHLRYPVAAAFEDVAPRLFRFLFSMKARLARFFEPNRRNH
jgi:glycosyltransferase involved in cell wall biosynthesis